MAEEGAVPATVGSGGAGAREEIGVRREDVEREPPSGDEAEVNAILAAVQGGVDKIKADPGVLSPQVKFDPQKKGHQLAKEYGMKECAT